MRSAIIAVLLSLTIVGGAMLVVDQPALAQSGGKGKDKSPPPPPPPPRCPDLALATYAFLSQAPGGTPLAADEIALQWNVNNAGTMAYRAASTMQSLVLEYMSAAGPHQIAITTVPESNGQAAAPTAVSLSQGASWRGVLRATLPPEAQHRRLRLRLTYNIDEYTRANDCDTGNNTMDLVRTAMPVPAPPPTPAPTGN